MRVLFLERVLFQFSRNESRQLEMRDIYSGVSAEFLTISVHYTKSPSFS